jgi:hypothetical protein
LKLFKIFLRAFLYCNHQVHRNSLIILYIDNGEINEKSSSLKKACRDVKRGLPSLIRRKPGSVLKQLHGHTLSSKGVVGKSSAEICKYLKRVKSTRVKARLLAWLCAEDRTSFLCNSVQLVDLGKRFETPVSELRYEIFRYANEEW